MQGLWQFIFTLHGQNSPAVSQAAVSSPHGFSFQLDNDMGEKDPIAEVSRKGASLLRALLSMASLRYPSMQFPLCAMPLKAGGERGIMRMEN